MKKNFPLQAPNKHPDRVLDGVKHEIRKYIKRERARPLPAGADYWDFDCQLGPSQEAAAVVHVAELTRQIDLLVQGGATQLYVEVLARPAQRKPRPVDILQRSLDAP